jgi:hypothetical protein
MTLWGYVEGDMWKVDAYLLKYNGRPRSAFNWLSEIFRLPDRLSRQKLFIRTI